MALAINIGLLLLLLTLGIIPTPGKKDASGIVVDLIPEGERTQAPAQAKPQPKRESRQTATHTPTPKPPPIILPVKPTIAAPQYTQIVELSSTDMAAGDIANAPHAQPGGGGGNSEAVGRAPNGEVMYAAKWARHPTDAELGGYLPKNAPDGQGIIACKTIPGNRVDDCVEIGQSPPGSHLASAVRQAAWQFRVSPPRKNGVPMIGAWVRIGICYNVPGCEE